MVNTSKLWIGGSSGLARSYYNAFCSEEDCSEWLVVGLEAKKPEFLPPKTKYIACDLRDLSSQEKADKFWHDCAAAGTSIRQILLSVRPPLVTHRVDTQAWRYASEMLWGMECLLCAVLSADQNNQIFQVLHISSIAAVSHLEGQRLRSESDPDPDSIELQQPYDRFKRASEELVQRLCGNEDTVEYTNLRFGAIFSDSPTCIQCNALALQAVVGPYLDLPIDCNSSRNAACLMRCILQRQPKSQPNKLRPVYYYTRPLLHPEPVPYGQYLVDYRTAYDMRYAIWIPTIVVDLFVAFVHALSTLFSRWIPYLQSIDYLLQVTGHEHSFGSTAVRQDFPQLAMQEETIEACFRRRKELLNGTK